MAQQPQRPAAVATEDGQGQEGAPKGSRGVRAEELAICTNLGRRGQTAQEQRPLGLLGVIEEEFRTALLEQVLSGEGH
jgi:hypothetical protein